MFIDIAIKKINPDAQFRITERGEEDNLDIAIIDWLNGTTPISKADIQTQLDLLIAEYDAKEYQRKRKPEYPKIEELVVALYDSEDKAAVDEKRAAVKLKYPKP
tara:strand:+ start:40 stop:351 length:312 start_codon:yes stop_codon:yes gene_type:complete